MIRRGLLAPTPTPHPHTLVPVWPVAVVIASSSSWSLPSNRPAPERSYCDFTAAAAVVPSFPPTPRRNPRVDGLGEQPGPYAFVSPIQLRMLSGIAPNTLTSRSPLPSHAGCHAVWPRHHPCGPRLCPGPTVRHAITCNNAREHLLRGAHAGCASSPTATATAPGVRSLLALCARAAARHGAQGHGRARAVQTVTDHARVQHPH